MSTLIAAIFESVMSGNFQNDVLAHFASFLSGYCILISFCWFFGSWASQYLKSKFVLQVLLEGLAAFQVIVGASEGAGISLKYGVRAWCLYTILRVILQTYIFHGATADPIMTLLNKSWSKAEKCVVVLVQVFAGFLAKQCMPYLWQLSPSSLHIFRLTTVNEACFCDMKVTVLEAFFIQLLYLSSIYVAEYSLPQMGKVFTLTTYFILVAVPGLPYTGMHINPLTAFVFNWSCSDTHVLSMCLVYIIPPIVAAQVARYLNLTSLPDEANEPIKKARKQKKSSKVD